MRPLRYAIMGVLMSCLASCSPTANDQLSLNATNFQQLTGWEQQHHAGALSAFLQSCEVWKKRPAERQVGCHSLRMPASQWHSLCQAAASVELADNNQVRNFFEAHFTPYRMRVGYKDEGLFTGYYIPEVSGSRRRGGPYQTPVYGMPKDVKPSTPYHSRAEIYAGALKGKGLEIAWVDDPVQLFFIEIQGSGVIRLNDGTLMTIGFAGRNHHPYTAIGRPMEQQGLLEPGKVNLFTIKQWLYDHPDRAQSVMEENDSFIFFRELPDNRIRGGEGSALTAERSLAIDTGFIPYSLPIFVETTLPATRFGPETPFNQLMIAQDTGSAIKGGIRGDIYFGHGLRAEALAGLQAHRGQATLLVPKVKNAPPLLTIQACKK